MRAFVFGRHTCRGLRFAQVARGETGNDSAIACAMGNGVSTTGVLRFAQDDGGETGNDNDNGNGNGESYGDRESNSTSNGKGEARAQDGWSEFCAAAWLGGIGGILYVFPHNLFSRCRVLLIRL